VYEVRWTDNLDYCDQFIQLASGDHYYNTIFKKA